MNRGDATVDAPIPEGSFRCAECYFINANLRLQCKQCMHLRFPTFDKRHLAVQKIVLKNTSGVLKTPGVLGKKFGELADCCMHCHPSVQNTWHVNGLFALDFDFWPIAGSCPGTNLRFTEAPASRT